MNLTGYIITAQNVIKHVTVLSYQAISLWSQKTQM